MITSKALKLLATAVFAILSVACTPLQGKNDAAWNNYWDGGEYYAPPQTDL
ncbi:MAG: hypothetical protein AB7L92_08605 [Alphaproteobacteria bacterium]